MRSKFITFGMLDSDRVLQEKSKAMEKNIHYALW